MKAIPYNNSAPCIRSFLLLVVIFFAAAVSGAYAADSHYLRKQAKIYGGSRSPSTSDWYAVSTGSRFLCGSSLISERVLLTAAHCANAFPEGGNVRIGGNNNSSRRRRRLLENGETENGETTTSETQSAAAETKSAETEEAVEAEEDGGIIRTVVAVQAHEDFDPQRLHNDIMLVLLDEPVTNDMIVPVELNSRAKLPRAGQRVTTMGYDLSRNDNDETATAEATATTVDLASSIVLKSPPLVNAELIAIDMEECIAAYENVVTVVASPRSNGQVEDAETEPVVIDGEIMFCAGHDDAGTCPGDSGGPLVISSSGVQVGIISGSASADCTEESSIPTFFTRVSAYIDWIDETSAALQEEYPYEIEAKAEEETMDNQAEEKAFEMEAAEQEVVEEAEANADELEATEQETVDEADAQADELEATEQATAEEQAEATEETVEGQSEAKADEVEDATEEETKDEDTEAKADEVEEATEEETVEAEAKEGETVDEDTEAKADEAEEDTKDDP